MMTTRERLVSSGWKVTGERTGLAFTGGDLSESGLNLGIERVLGHDKDDPRGELVSVSTGRFEGETLTANAHRSKPRDRV